MSERKNGSLNLALADWPRKCNAASKRAPDEAWFGPILKKCEESKAKLAPGAGQEARP
jgi:hypothetical protein